LLLLPHTLDLVYAQAHPITQATLRLLMPLCFASFPPSRPARLLLQVVHVGVGPVSQSDVQLAVPLGAKVLGFNVRTAAPDVDALAKMHGVEVCVCVWCVIQ
jgi:hypothetical protein